MDPPDPAQWISALQRLETEGQGPRHKACLKFRDLPKALSSGSQYGKGYMVCIYIYSRMYRVYGRSQIFQKPLIIACSLKYIVGLSLVLRAFLNSGLLEDLGWDSEGPFEGAWDSLKGF